MIRLVKKESFGGKGYPEMNDDIAHDIWHELVMTYIEFARRVVRGRGRANVQSAKKEGKPL